MESIFRQGWQALEPADVEAFLAEATEEGLTWEAKSEQPRPASLAKAVGGMANAIGGFVMLGVAPAATGWVLPGAAFNVEEPGTWATSVLGARLRPVPDLDVRVFDRPGGRKAVLIRVQPVGAPPCVTTDGIVFQRVSGQTVPVTDQAVMADLLTRGRAARSAAEAAARHAAVGLRDRGPMFTTAEVVYTVGAAALTHVPDKAGRLFSRAFVASMHDRAATLRFHPGISYTPRRVVSQDALLFGVGHSEIGEANLVGAYWTGSTAVGYAGGDAALQDLFPNHVRRAWRTAMDALAEYGGRGEAYVAILMNGDALIDQRAAGLVEVDRWSEVREPTEEEVASVERELRRAFGETALEP